MSLSAIVASALVFAAVAEPSSDTEAWNRGVDFYCAGDVTNALSVLRPLMFSQDFSARAATVVAKLEYDAGNFEEALASAQIALMANPKGKMENDNFSRVVAKIEAYRENRHIDEVLKAAQGKDPGSMLRKATAECRDLLVESGTYRTNTAERTIEISLDLSRRTQTLADVWIPVREVIVNNVTNEQEAAYILPRLEAARSATLDAAVQLEDLNGEAYDNLAKCESELTAFLKLCILPPDAIDEDFIAQSNALTKVETVNGCDWQSEARDFTVAFRSKFPAWARAYEQQAQNDTNREPFTAETQAKISALATELEKLQMDLLGSHDPERQQEAIEKIIEIKSLLPKDKNGAGGASGEPQAQPQDQDSQAEPRENGEQQQNETEQDQTVDEAKDEKAESIEALLKKAEERNEEYEAKRKAFIRKAALPPNERDW